MSKNNQQSSFDLNKLPGFENLDKKFEERNMKSYNEDYFSSLNSMKDSLIPIEKNRKLALGAEINTNSSVTSMTGQILSNYEELVKSNIELYKQVHHLRHEIKEVKIEIDKIDKDIIALYKPEVEKLRKLVQTFLCEQKTENFRLLKEIKILETDKAEVEEEISLHLDKLKKLEKSIGNKNTVFVNEFDKTVKGKKVNDC